MARFGEHCSTLLGGRHSGAIAAVERTLHAERPDLDCDGPGFAKHFCARIPGRPTPEAIAGMRAGDLLLAWAAAEGQPVAVAAFEAEVMPMVQRALRGIDASADFVGEVANRVRTKLLVGRPKGLDRYLGQGPLASFAMVVAMREAVDAKRTVRIEDTLEQVIGGLADPQRAADSLAARKQAAVHLQPALDAALAALSPRQRTILRLHLVKGVSAEKLAAMYGVHRATTTRWITEARTHVLAHITDALRTRLRIGARTFRGLQADLVDGVDITLSGMMMNAESEPDP